MMILEWMMKNYLTDLHTNESQYNNIPISFLDNIKYYLLFDKEVKFIEQENGNIYFENYSGTFELQLKQLNSKN